MSETVDIPDGSVADDVGDFGNGAGREDATGAARCWVVSNGRAGTQNQALGLARALKRQLAPQIALSVVIKQIVVDRSLSRMLLGPLLSTARGRTGALNRLSPKGHLLRPPFPDLWIAAGNDTVGVTMAVKHANPQTFTIQTQDPRAPASAFDCVVPPHHDAIRGPNVLPMIGAPTPLTRQRIAEERARLDDWFTGVPARYVTVLLGGNNKRQWISPAQIDDLISSLTSLNHEGYGALISGSRRTDARVLTILREAFAGQLKKGSVRLIDSADVEATGFNPYPAILANPAAILVTEDSVNMVSEAAMTGRPVYTLGLCGSPGKFRRFHETMRARGITRPFTGTIETWTYAPFDETARIASALAKTLKEKGVFDRPTVAPNGDDISV